MYLIVETVHQECEGDKAEWRTMRQTFRAELGRALKILASGGSARELRLLACGRVLFLLVALIILCCL